MRKRVILIVLSILLILTVSCTTESDRHNPVLNRDIWTPIDSAVGYSTNDMLLIILRRQEIINHKLDLLLQQNEAMK